MTVAEFAQGIGMLEAIGKGAFRPDVEAALASARSTPDDAQALFGAGYRLNEAQLPEIAATALARANTLAPNLPTVVNEFASSLQAAGFFNDAFVELEAATDARSQDWQSRYLYALNALMAGNGIAAQQAFTELGEPEDEAGTENRDSLSLLLERQEKIASATRLDSQDLRGWHHVVTGGILTHISPHGFNEGMNGRYSNVQDSDELVHEGVLRSLAVLQAWNIRPPQLMYSDDRSSEILAHIWNERVGIPIKDFREADIEAPGLFLAYDLGEADEEFLDAMQEHRPDQILVSHASSWTEQSDYSSDLTTFQYQSNIAPWDAEAATDEPGSLAATVSAPAKPATAAVARRILGFLTEPREVATRIVAATVASESVADLDELSSLARAAGPPPTTGHRDRFPISSPVKSPRSA